jgi:hypothetical protein
MSSIDLQNPASLESARERLLEHPLYTNLNSRESVQIFMKHHVFAVWDFFSLLKRLQQEVTCVTVPWLPRGLGDHARFITEIVLAEESDEGIGGGHLSHFELYLTAMDEMDADRGPIDRYIACVSSGQDAIAALDSCDLPQTVRAFTSHTLSVATLSAPHEVAASFCHGRENLLFDVFVGARDNMTAVLAGSPVFKHYLERHITLDHDEHGPLALSLLSILCDGDPDRIEAAERVAIEAVEARRVLWDGVLDEIQQTAAQEQSLR